MKRNIKEILSQMTIEEKASLCSGLDFWRTKPIERLGIPSIMMTDGPHGLRKQDESADHLGLMDSVPATCFPSAAGLASSWNRELIEEVGQALGEECQAENVAIILGPGANIKRSPLCGRNFEYFSEDPYLSSEMAAHHIKGVQSQGVGTSLKHFAVNNQEHRRMSVNAEVDERTLREIYLTSFERAVKQSQPWTVMASYNRVNGVFASENKYLLTDILKEEWSHEGFVVSDWGAVNERVDSLEAGLELEMPGNGGMGDQKIVEAVKTGKLSLEALDRAVERLLTVIFKAVDNKKEQATYDKQAHHKLVRQVAGESMVLLKNEADILPLRQEANVAVIGQFAKKPRYQGGGSSHINPTFLDNTYEEIVKAVDGKANVLYADGYTFKNDEYNEPLLDEAKSIAQQSDVAILFVGLPDEYESEGYDRTHLNIPESHQQLIQAVSSVQPNVIVVLSNGAPIEMPWINQAKAVIEGYLGGQALGGAIADVIYGNVNPSGKLAETFPEQLSDNPSYLYFPGTGDKVEYREGIFVGYRYYDKKRVKPLFPFGFGLSYTTFEYSDLTVDKTNLTDKDTVQVSVKVKNTGKVTGKEIVQLYVSDVESNVSRPEKELKGFEKVALEPGEEKTVTFTLDKRSFAYYNVDLKDWHVETGQFEIKVGASSRDIRLTTQVVVESSVDVPTDLITRNTLLGDLLTNSKYEKALQKHLEAFQKASGFGDALSENPEMLLAMMRYLPLRGMVLFGLGQFTETQLNELIADLNNI
jgi:beta-glucosidase